MTEREELHSLARTLADWMPKNTTTTIYLFGSRVRGDHRPDSDVDIYVKHNNPTPDDMSWWAGANTNEFKLINEKLPGVLRILEYNDPLGIQIMKLGESPIHRDRNVICVWKEPKPSSRIAPHPKP